MNTEKTTLPEIIVKEFTIDGIIDDLVSDSSSDRDHLLKYGFRGFTNWTHRELVDEFDSNDSFFNADVEYEHGRVLVAVVTSRGELKTMVAKVFQEGGSTDIEHVWEFRTEP